MKKPQVINVLCEVLKVWIAFSEEKNTPSVRLKCQRISEDEQSTGEIYYANLYLTDLAIEQTTETLWKVFAWRGSITQLADTPELWAGRRCSLVIQENEKGWKDVKYVNPDTASRDKNRSAMIRALAVYTDRKMAQHWNLDGGVDELQRGVEAEQADRRVREAENVK